MPTPAEEVTAALALTVKTMKARTGRYKHAQVRDDADEAMLVETLRRGMASINHEVEVKEGFPTETVFRCSSCDTRNGCFEGAVKHATGNKHGKPPMPEAAREALGVIQSWYVR